MYLCYVMFAMFRGKVKLKEYKTIQSMASLYLWSATCTHLVISIGAECPNSKKIMTTNF